MTSFYLLVFTVLFLFVIGHALNEGVSAQLQEQEFPTGLSINTSTFTPQEGNVVTFSGNYLIKGSGSPDRLVTVRDMTTNAILGESTTDSRGYYLVIWKPAYNDIGSHKIRASSITYYDDVVAFEAFIDVKVISNSKPILTLNASPLSTVAGNTVTFSGILLVKDTPIPDYIIQIKDAFAPTIIVADGITDINGRYVVIWDTTIADVKSHTFVAQNTMPEKTIYRSPTYTSNFVKMEVTPQITSCKINLVTNPKSIEGNQSVNIQGTLSCNNIPVNQRVIEILDKSNNQMITSTFSGNDGFYSISWDAPYENSPHDIYARFSYNDADLATSNIDTVTVKKAEEIKLILEPQSTAKPGSKITIFGHITHDGFEGQEVLIKIDGQKFVTEKIDDTGNFSEPWIIPSNAAGEKQISAECECNGENLQSNIVTFFVNQDLPTPIPTSLQLQILPSTTSGESPLTVALNARVDGGTPQYFFDWDVNGQKYSSNSVHHTFFADNKSTYRISLVVTDSLQQQIKDEIFITVSVPETDSPKIYATGETLEGSQITFTAIGSSLQDSYDYEWSFDDGNFANTLKATHVYGDNGRYDVKLLVKNNDKVIHQDNKLLEIQNKAPEITFLKSQKYSVDVNETVQLEGRFTDAGRDDTFTVKWNIDNKQFTKRVDSPQTVTQNYKFESPGRHVLSLIVLDDDGNQDKQEISLKVEEPFP